jgi:hypothetical protein
MGCGAKSTLLCSPLVQADFDEFDLPDKPRRTATALNADYTETGGYDVMATHIADFADVSD